MRLQASDAGRDGGGKLDRLAPTLPVIGLFSSLELSLALGRENVVHAALMAGGGADRFKLDATRLAAFLGVAAEKDD